MIIMIAVPFVVAEIIAVAVVIVVVVVVVDKVR
jgi:hypothetical protein